MERFREWLLAEVEADGDLLVKHDPSPSQE
jgi:hypothetical protein